MRHAHYRHIPSPIMIFAFGMLLFWAFGFKLFFFLPLFFIFGGFGMWSCGMTHHDEYDWSDEKPKRKRKNDDYIIIDDEDDITYL